MIDLHCHTRASDGENKPQELVAKALQKGLSAIAVTDHDTMAGIPAALAAARGTGLEVVPGIEFSTFHMGKEVHILTFFLPFDDRRLNSFLAELTRQREERGRKMIERLNAIGYELTYGEAAAIADGAPIMSPHIARALWAKGVLKDFQEAAAFYQKHLVLGTDVYIPHAVDLRDVLEITHDIKCPIAVAHPHKIGDDEVVADLIKMGCQGMEGYYPETDESTLEHYRKWARREGLFITGGSDYHGIYSTRELGSANVPDEVLEGIRAVRDGLRN
jgi:hypothetical protein